MIRDELESFGFLLPIFSVLYTHSSAAVFRTTGMECSASVLV